MDIGELDVEKITRISLMMRDFSTSMHIKVINFAFNGGNDFESLVKDLDMGNEVGYLEYVLRDLSVRGLIEIDKDKFQLTNSGNIACQMLKLISGNKQIGNLLSQLFSKD